MNISTMAASTLRPMTTGIELADFMASHGGSLGGTFHCPVYMGVRMLWDYDTDECFSAEGVILPEAEHLKPQLRLIADEVLRETGVQAGMDGILVKVKDSPCHFRIIDLASPELSLWRQVNLLTDLAASLESELPHVRPAQHFHTPSVKSEKQLTRWLKTWKRPGLGGIYIKEAEMIYSPGVSSSQWCFVKV
ncbi:hypothetical protein [Oleidesulfovibrio sp.]|uniref:hypothetical protein n=1 Tax=Oleidesulfovibrio sp. TaxID=2909707 RepID=UPI003A896A25